MKEKINMLEWEWRTFSSLSGSELYDILALREAVFSIEQRCFYTDMDYCDQDAVHLLGVENNKLIAYARVLPEHLPYPNAISFGRVLVSHAARKKNIGKQLIIECLNYLEKHHTNTPIIISAQLYLQKFYEGFGFSVIGEPYDEAGIMHIKMKRKGSSTKLA